MLGEQQMRWWSIRIQTLTSIRQFLQYAGRYIRRSPRAGYRISSIGKLHDHHSTDLLCDRFHIVAKVHHPTHEPNPEIDEIISVEERRRPAPATPRYANRTPRAIIAPPQDDRDC